MTCARCGHANPEQAKFCLECGAALAIRCASCGTELPPAARFCLECGARTAAAPAAPPAAPEAGVRKVVTIVFADLAGSTALHERLDAESARRLMERYYAALRGAVDAHGGTVVKLLGDGVMAAFGLRQVAEDDAERAVRAAVAMQDAFRGLRRQQAPVAGGIGLRVAVNTGEVVVGGAHDDLIGDPVNVAARLQEQGGDGDVVVGEATHRLVAARVTLEPLGSLELKGRAESVAAYRVASLDPPAGAAAAPFVGRAGELARLDAVIDAAVTTPATRLAVLLGSPGLGKSRLIDELARRHGERVTLLSAHCDAAGGATFAPLATALRAHLGLEDAAVPETQRAAVEGALPGDDADRARVAAGLVALLAGAPPVPEETFFAVRRFLAALAARRPVLLAIDDLHWGEPLLLDLVEHLAQWGAGVPLCVLVGARPELRDLRAGLCAPGALVADVVTLAGLDAGAATRLAAAVIGAADLPAAVAAKVLATSEGNPLFVGELVRMLVREGALTRDGERWTAGAGLAALEMPPTIHALLAARIERLRPEERQVLERAAVVGRLFSRGAVAALLPPGAAADLDARLEALRRGELIERDSGWLLGEPTLRFHHVLIRDAAYRRLLKATRAELHGRLADWIEAQAGAAVEHDETIGRHLEQAHVLLGELGPLDVAGRALGARAAARLAAAGRRALAGDDVALAAGLLGRAVARLDAGDDARAELALDWCEALLAAGDVAQASEAIDALGRVAAEPAAEELEGGEASPATTPSAGGPTSRLRAWHACFAGQLAVLTDPAALQATAAALAAAAAALTALGDAAGEAKAHSVHAQALARLGQVGACEAALDRALAAARRAGDRRRANAVLAGAPLAALWGPSPVTRASGRCLDVVRVLRITQGAPAVEAAALSCQGVMEALRGRTDAARRMLAAARQMVEELGIVHRLHETDAFAGRIAAMQGDAAAAEPLLRGATDGLRALGLGIDAARAGALLARVLLAQDRAAEAEALSHESEALAGDDLQAAIAWRGVRAEALARRGEHEAAIALAQSAVAIAAATDALLDHADARLALAAALRAAGRAAEADAEEQRAVELWEAKGATLLAERVRQRQPAAVGPRAPAEPAASDGGGATAARAAAPGGDGPARHVAANAATALAGRLERAFAASDARALAGLWSDALIVVDHPTGASYGRAGHLDSLRRLRQAREPRLHLAPLAALGEHLALCRRTAGARGTSSRRVDVADWERAEFVLVETGDDGAGARLEIFADDRLGEAIAALYARHAERLPEGSARRRAAVTAQAVAYILTDARTADESALFAPTYADVDHRSVGYGALSPGEASQLVATDRTLADQLRYRVDEILALRADGLVRTSTTTGIWRDGGGAFERTLCRLSIFGPDGRAMRQETFDADRRAEALARFAALTEGGAVGPAAAFANAASASIDREMRCWAARDWEGLQALGSPAIRFDDRRRLFRVEAGFDEVVAQGRLLFEQPRSRWIPSLIATRGDRLALHRVTFEAEVAEGGGPLEIEDHFRVVEVDGGGRWTALVLFDRDDEGAARTELDARYANGEGAADPRGARFVAEYERCFGARDWGALMAIMAPALVAQSHRLTGWGTVHGPEALVATMRTQIELAPDTRMRMDHVRASGDGVLFAYAWVGTHEGGEFENLYVVVAGLDADGRARRIDVWEHERAGQALAWLARPRGDAAAGPLGSPVRIPPNAAAAASDRQAALVATADWDAVRALHAPALAFEDQRPLLRTTTDGEAYLTGLRWANAGGDLRIERTLLATAGDRLALLHNHFARDGEIFEIETLALHEVDADGRLLAIVLFAPDDRAAASDALLERYAALGAGGTPPATLELARAWQAHDLAGMQALLPDDFYLDDRRRVGIGRRDGAGACLASLAAIWKPGRGRRTDVLYVAAHAPHGCLYVARQSGAHGADGALDAAYACLGLADGDRPLGLELYELEDLDAARARLAALGADPASPTRPERGPRGGGS